MRKILGSRLLIALQILSVSVFSSCTKLDEYNPAGLSEENVLRNFDAWKGYQSNCYTCPVSYTHLDVYQRQI